MDYGQLFCAGAPMITPPPLRDDCFALPAGVDWMPVKTALALLKEKLTCRVASTELPLQQAVGRFLSSDLYAQRNSPPHANSAVDGYAVFFDTNRKGRGHLSAHRITLLHQ